MPSFTQALVMGILWTLICVQIAGAGTDVQPVPSKAQVGASAREAQDRRVDQAALAAQQDAVNKLRKMLNKYRGSHQEPMFLARLAEFELQSAALLFRIGHGKNSAKDLKAYKDRMKEAIGTLSSLIQRYPHYPEMAQVVFQRGKAFEEIEDKNAATKDYLRLTKEFKDAPEVLPAYMSLAAFAAEANQHAQAVKYLVQVEAHKDSPYYPFALYKLAWSHYNLKQIPEAMNYVAKHVGFYEGKTSSADVAFRENMLLDSTVFFFEGFEQKKEQFAVTEALRTFRTLKPGDVLGRMAAKTAKLLRSHNHDRELLVFKDLVIKEEGNRPEALDVLTIAYEHHENHRRFKEMIAIAQDMGRLYALHPAYEGFKAARKILLGTAEKLQAAVIKNKHAKGVKELSRHLADLYASFTKIVTDEDPRVPRVHYNLAETLFEINEFADATTHYRWVADRPASLKHVENASTLKDAALKAAGARYAWLKQQNKLPQKLEAVSLTKDRTTELGKEEAEWITWVEELLSKTHLGDDAVEGFAFESYRILYDRGRVKEAVDRMISFTEKRSGSKYAIPAASLVMDTRIATGDWQETLEQTIDFRKVKAWKTHEFAGKLARIQADANYKLAEAAFKAQRYEECIDRARDFIESGETGERREDMLSLASSAAIERTRTEEAVEFLSLLIHKNEKSKHYTKSLKSRAILHENAWRYADAARDIMTYLATESGREDGDRKALARKVLIMARLSGNTELRTSVLKSALICKQNDLEEDCDRAQAYLVLDQGVPAAGLPKDLLERARKGPEDNRTPWSTVALMAEQKGHLKLSFHERLSLIRSAANYWKELDPLEQLSLVKDVSIALPTALAKVTESIPQFSPLKPTERAIRHRIETLREIENSLTRVVKLPWARIRARGLSEMATGYIHFAKQLRELPAPKGLPPEELKAYEDTIAQVVVPFEEKGFDLRSKAFEIASKSAIEKEDFDRIAALFFEENPSQATALKKEGKDTPRISQALSFKNLDQLEPTGNWNKAIKDSKNGVHHTDPVHRLPVLWVTAIREKNLTLAGHLLQVAREQRIIPEPRIEAMQVISLAAAGAQAEALAQIEESFPTVVERLASR
jgi:tetratricopeptide (TPR) repeat protein